MSFTYNDSGIRTSKTVNGVTTTYYLDGSRIVGEETNGNITVYFYDSLGLPIGFGYNASTYGLDVFEVYWYEKNLQGDIVAIYNHVGTKLLTYTYDAWGACYTTNASSSVPTVVTNNPFRYRGYYYDNDLSLYYLNARYYDGNTGRFISAEPNVYNGGFDRGSGLLSCNVYVYCANNPITNIDYTGEWAISVGLGASAVMFGGISYSISIAIDNKGGIMLQLTEANIFKKQSGALLGALNAGVSTIFSLHSSDTVYEMLGESYGIGGSAGTLGFELSCSDLDNISSSDWSISVSKGVSVATVDASIPLSKTYELWDIGKSINDFWEGVKSWFK